MKNTLIFIVCIALTLPVFAQNQKDNNTDYKLWVYHSLPISRDEAMKIFYKMMPNYNNLDEIEIRKSFPFSKVAKLCNMKTNGVIKIYSDKIYYDTIDSLVFTSGIGLDGMEIKCIYSNKQKPACDSCYDAYTIFNINNHFLKEHKVYLNTFSEINDPVLKSTLLNEIYHYDKKDDNHQWDFYLSDKYTYKKINDADFFNYFYVVLERINNVPIEDFCMATFYYKYDSTKTYTTSFLFNKKKIIHAGHFFPYFSFSIDSKWYFAATHAVIMDTGWWGKFLYVFENGQFKLLISDYSLSD